jgi:ribonuclease HII
LLLDFLELPDLPLPQTSLVKGDQRSLSIAAASVLAKTARDDLMRQLDTQYPGYGFAVHKGYGTLAHRQALQALGPSPIHRTSFHLKNAQSM